MFQLILKNLRKHMVATVAVVLSVVISVAVVFALSLLYEGVEKGLQTSSERLGADLVVVPAETEGQLDDSDLLFTGTSANYYMDADDVAAVQAVDGVERTTEQFFCQTLTASSCCTEGLNARIIGFDLATDWVIKPWIQDDVDALEPDQVIIGSGVVGTQGGQLQILGKSFEVVSQMDYTGTSMDYSVMMDIDAARQLAKDKMEYASLWEEYGDPMELVTAVLVDVADDANLDGITRLIRYKTGASVVKSGDAIGQIQDQMRVIFLLMLGAAVLMGIASLVQLFARFYTMTWDRKTEFGLYRALGARKGTLRALIYGEMLLIVVGGSVIGLAGGYGLFRLVLSLVATSSSFPFANPAFGFCMLAALAVLVLMVVIGLVSTAAPVRQLNKISPVLAMQRGNID